MLTLVRDTLGESHDQTGNGVPIFIREVHTSETSQIVDG